MAGDTIPVREGMLQFFNQYSFLLAAVFGLAVLAFVLLRDGLKASDLIALASLAFGFTAAFALLRPQASPVGSAQEVLSRIGGGAPVLLELQSPF